MARIDVQMNFTANKSSLNEISTLLKQIQSEASKASLAGTLTDDLKNAANEARRLENILNNSYNSKIGQIDLSKFNNSIKSAYGGLDQLKNRLESMGQGNVFNKMQSSLLGTNMQLKESNKLLDEMATTMANTIKWGVTSSIFDRVTNSIQRAYEYSKALDSSLNDIRIVTGYSAEQMEVFAQSANRAASALGASTRDYTNASLIYYQQGLNDQEVQARTETTLKAANVTGQTGEEVSEQLTAIWNGYKVTAEETELYIDKVAKVAATTAADLEELSTGMSKVASAANNAGVDIDQLNATLATVISVTREAPETVGTAFRSIYARLGDLALDGEDEFGVSLGTVSGQMEELGIQILDEQGQMRDMGEIIEDTATKWQTWTQAQRQAAAVAIAGKQQYSRLIALFDNWDMYTEALNESQSAMGTLNEQQEIYMDSLEAHLQQLSTEAERTYDILFDENAVKGMADAITGLLSVFNNYFETLGGGLSSIANIGLTVSNIFSKQIGTGIGNALDNIQKSTINQQNIQGAMELASVGNSRKDISEYEADAYQRELDYSQRLLDITKDISSEKYNELNTMKHKLAQDELQVAAIYEYQDNLEKNKNYYNDIITDLKTQNDIINKLRKTQRDMNLDYEESVDILSVGVKTADEEKTVLDAQENTMKRLKVLQDSRYKISEQTAGKLSELAKIQNANELTDTKMTEAQQLIKDILSEQVVEQERLLRLKQAATYLDNPVKRQDLENNVQKEQRDLDTALQAEERNIQIQNAIQGITALVSITQQFVGIVNTLNDDSLSGWEKFQQIGSTLLIMFPTLVMNIKEIATLPTSLKAVKAALDSTTVSVMGLQMSMWQITLIVAAIAAVIAIFVQIGNVVYDAYTKDARAAEQAALANQQLEDSYKSLSEQAKELKENITGYEEAKKDLEELNKKTDEYTETLRSANEQARELIETLGLYDDYEIKNGLIEIDPEALAEAQLRSTETLSDVEQMMYQSRINSNKASLKSDTTDLARAIGSVWTPEVREKLINGQYYTKEASREVTMSNDSLNQIVSALSKREDAETILNNNESLKNFILNIEGLNSDIKYLIDNIIEEKDALGDLITRTREAAEANAYYVEQMNASAIKEQFSTQLKQMATDESGIFDEARYNQLVDIINKSEPQQTVQEQKSSTPSMSQGVEGLQDELTSEFLSNENKFATELIENFDSDLSSIGGKIESDEDLSKKYAQYILGKTQEEINELIFKDGKLQDTSGNVVVDSSNAEQRGAQRTQLIDYAWKEYTDENIENQQQEPTLDFIENLNQAQYNAAVLGEQYGTDFSQALLNAISSETKEFDLSSTFARLDPNEVGELQSLSTEQLMQMFGLSEESILQLGFESGEQFATNFQKALSEYKWDPGAAIKSSIEEETSQLKEIGDEESATFVEENAEDIEKYAENLMQVADNSSELADELEYDSDLAVDFARRVMKMNDAIDTLADNIEDWTDILKNSSETSEEYADAMYGMRSAIADVYDVSMDYVSNDFITEHLSEIQDIAKGDEKAIESLRSALAEEVFVNIVLRNDIENVDGILSNFRSLRSQIEGQLSNLQIGAPVVDDGALVESLNKLIQDCELTVEQANSVFSALGVEPTYETETVEQEQSNPIVETTTYTEETDGKDLRYIGPDGEEHVAKVPNFKQIQTSRTVGYTTDTVKVPVTAIAANGKQPKISGIKKAPGGSMNNYSSKNKGGGSPGGSKKSGGGGGSSQPKEPSKEEKVESEKDPYHDIDIRIKGISDSLDKLSDQQSKFFGQKLIDNLNSQYKLLEEQIDATTEKIQIARGEQARLRAELSQKGVTFNANGTISNYSAAYDAQLSYVNSLIDKYNGMSAEEQEKFKETLDKAKEDFDEFVKDIEEYDETVTETIPGLKKDIQEAIDKQIEIQIEKFNMEIEIRLDLAEAERDWNEFKKNVIDQIDEDDILGNAEARLEDFFSYYKDDGTGIVQRNTVHIEDILTQLKQMDDTGWSDVYGDNRAQALEDLQTYYEQMMEDLQDLEELQDEIHESYLDMIDEAQDKFDEQIDTFEQITSLIEHDMDLIELINGEESYSELANYYEKLEDNYNKQLDFQRQQVEFWKQQMDLAEQGSEEWEAARDNWMDAVEDWRSTVEDAVENATDKYVNAINEIFQNLNDKVTNGMGLDYVEEEWNLINQNADQYLDTINSMYGIQDLENKYLDAIDQTDNISAQQKLNDLMQEELAALQEKDKLTQYDIDRANMKYEIALKQIALEEAQQNKSQLRLRRDSQGNYSYQFVSDESEIGQLKDELNELYNQLYNFDLEHYKDNLDQIYSVWVEYQEKMAEAAQINDPEERAQREALLQEQYGELINGLVEQNETIRLNLHESAFTELAELYDIDLENFKQLSEDQKDILLGDMIPQWTSGVQDMADVFAGEDGFTNVCKDAMEDLKEATEDYEQSLEDIESTAGISFDTILDGTDNIINQTEDLLWENDELINSYENQLDAIRDIINELSSLIAKYNAAREAAITATEAAYKYWQEQQRQAAAEAAKENANSGASSNSGSSNSGSSGGGKGSGGGDGVLNVGDTVTYTGGTYYYDSYGTSPAGNRGPGKKVTVTQVKEDGRPYPIHVQSNNSAYGWLKRSQLSGYDTGGYTGDWGDNSGKLALLHKKELVLNRSDTSNLLQGIQILRNIVDSVGSSMISRMANLTSNIGINSNIPTSSDTLEQNVHIEANFPNVESSKEIEDALNNLVNVASQRVHRRR